MKKLTQRTNVYFNGDLFWINTLSTGMLAYPEPDAEPYILAPEVDNAELGRTVKKALQVSKQVGLEEFQRIFKSNVLKNLEKDRETQVIQQFAYRNRREMYKAMDCCSITCVENKISISPSHHDSLDGYSGVGEGGSEVIHLDASISEEELGVAIREGFKRCTSIFGR